MRQFLKQNFYKNSRRGGRLVFGDGDCRHDRPRDGVRIEQLGEKLNCFRLFFENENVTSDLSDVSQFVCFESVNGFIHFDKDELEQLHVFAFDHAESRRRQTKELFIRPVLAAAVDDHVTHF